MPNRWTGDFDAVVQIAPAGADRLLAAIHRRGDPVPGTPPQGPHFLHSLSFNLPLPDAAGEPDLRGHVRAQVSTPSVRLADDPDRIAVSAELYAWFQDELGSEPAPEFVHGTLSFTTGVEFVQCSGQTLAEIRVGADDVEVAFEPADGSGLSIDDARLVETVVADFLRRGLRPTQLRVSSLGEGALAVGRLAFRTLRTGPRSALAALLGFGTGGAAPDPAAVDEVFLEPGESAGVALGRGFVQKALVAAALEPLSGIQVSGSRLFVSFQAAPDPSTLAIELLPGRLRARIDGAGSLSPGGSFEFRLTQEFGLVTTSGGNLALSVLGEPGLEITRGNFFLQRVFGLFRGRIRGALAAAALDVLPVANGMLNDAVDRTVRDLLSALEVPGVGARFTRATIDADALLFGARFDLGATKPVVASFASHVPASVGLSLELQQVRYDALASWIPGGTVERYRWLEVRADNVVARAVEERHRFVMQLAPQVSTLPMAYAWPPTTWCLEVHGRQFVDDLDPVPVSGTICGISTVVPSLDLPRSAGRLAVHVPDGEGGVLADLDPWARYRPHALARTTENRGALLVHRAGHDVRAAAATLRRALVEERPELPVSPVLLVEGGAHGYACGVDAAELAGLALTNDPQGNWRARFRLERPGATVLVGSDGRELWRDVGPLDAAQLGKVLDGLGLEEARPPRRRSVDLALPLGVFAPDFVFPCDSPELSLALSKLRGREVELCFWTSWSEASLEELRRRAHSACDDAPLVLCVNDGEDPELAAEVLRQHAPGARLVPDPERAIAARYGISCWPTVVRVDAESRVADVRFGLAAERVAARPGRAPSARSRAAARHGAPGARPRAAGL